MLTSQGERSDGRASQRRRTRNAIVAAATRLLEDGIEPTVSAAAEAAEVSRATAYRYFPTQDDLLSEATLELTLGATGGGDGASVVDEIAAIARKVSDHDQRIKAIVRRIAEFSYDQQNWLRRNLRSSLPASPLDHVTYERPGHRRDWIALGTDALRKTMPDAAVDRLNDALVALTGVEPIIALVDVGGLDRDAVIDRLGWAAEALTIVTTQSSRRTVRR